MTFYTYENWGARIKKKPFTKIHKGNCHYCNEGKGQRKDKTEGKNGKWHGPYKSFVAAKEKATTFNYEFNHLCKNCMKEYEL